MTATHPLSTHAPADTLAVQPHGRWPAGRYYADVRTLAPSLTGSCHVVNLCNDRYAFMVGFGAALVAGLPTLMPSTMTPAALAELASQYPGLICLHDGTGPSPTLSSEMAVLHVTVSWTEAPSTWAEAPQIAESQLAAIVFTSGSTGKPTPHYKHWGSLCRNGASEACRLGTAGMGIVATVPAQHMYGFESSVLLTLQGKSHCWHGKPFYPADVAAALAATPRPRMLVTTPFHLAKLLDADVTLPTCDALLCATAPLSVELARRAETALNAPLHEIYGCTESGQVASRHTCVDLTWQLLPGVSMIHDKRGTWVHGGHVQGRVLLSDVIEPAGEDRFHLIGRHADMVNVAGKRTSIGYLNAQLLAISGVQDGCFVQGLDGQDGACIERLAALCLAPTLTAQEVLTQLRSRIDPVFLPRPLVMLDAMPRNATGKLLRSDVLALLDKQRREPDT